MTMQRSTPRRQHSVARRSGFPLKHQIVVALQWWNHSSVSPPNNIGVVCDLVGHWAMEWVDSSRPPVLSWAGRCVLLSRHPGCVGDCRCSLSRRPALDLDRLWGFSQLLGVPSLAGDSSRACLSASSRTLDIAVFWGLSTNVLVRKDEGASTVSRSSAVSRTASVGTTSSVGVPMPRLARMGLQWAFSLLVSVATTSIALWARSVCS